MQSPVKSTKTYFFKKARQPGLKTEKQLLAVFLMEFINMFIN
jgi:hypothetical protein